jgi:hypothetical protein
VVIVLFPEPFEVGVVLSLEPLLICFQLVFGSVRILDLFLNFALAEDVLLVDFI